MCSDFNELVDVISSYISFCVDCLIPTRQDYKNKVEHQSAGGNFRDAWQGTKKMAAVDLTADSRHDFIMQLNDLKQSLIFEKSVIVTEDRQQTQTE